MEASKAVATALGGMVTLVLGYYFGSAAGEKQAEASRIEKEANERHCKNDVKRR